MKRFWLVLLSLGLIVAFSTSAMAVDVKFSGEYYAAGMYLDKTSFTKSSTGGNPSTAFYFQRLRVKTDFVVSPGLTLTTRADIMERAWGAARSNVPLVTSNDTLSAGTRAENENIAFDWAYLTYVSPIGAFTAGYQQDRAWGTVFGDNSYPNAKITYTAKIGDVILGAQMGKDTENSRTAINVVNTSDMDQNFYNLLAVYKAKTFEAGILFKYVDGRAARTGKAGWVPGSAPDYNQKQWTITSLPYFKAKLGPVALQGELLYTYGKVKIEDEHVVGATGSQVLLGTDALDIGALSGWLDATADFNKFYVGGSVALVAGDDPQTKDKIEGVAPHTSLDWQPCLIMFNSDRAYWAGALNGYNDGTPAAIGGAQATSNGGGVSNAWLAQFRGGVRPTEQFDIMASFTYARADKTPRGDTWEGRDYGYEIDVTGTYKITNNLSYMLGAGYFMTGNFYKGTTATSHDLNDDYMLINKLTLTF